MLLSKTPHFTTYTRSSSVQTKARIDYFYLNHCANSSYQLEDCTTPAYTLGTGHYKSAASREWRMLMFKFKTGTVCKQLGPHSSYFKCGVRVPFFDFFEMRFALFRSAVRGFHPNSSVLGFSCAFAYQSLLHTFHFFAYLFFFYKLISGIFHVLLTTDKLQLFLLAIRLSFSGLDQIFVYLSQFLLYDQRQR